MESKKVVILIADDDLEEHGFIKEALGSLKHCELCFFLDAKGLLNYMDTEQCVANLPKLIIVDLNMPVMDGFECIRQFKALPIYKDIPFICFTTSSSPEDRSKCKDLGAVEFITKPSKIVSYEELLLTSVQRWIPKPEVDTVINPLLPLPTHP